MNLLDRDPPEDGPLKKLRARQAEEDAAYAQALALPAALPLADRLAARALAGR